jgi:hypothetical protein
MQADVESVLEPCAASGSAASEHCARLARALRGDALAWWPGSPWRDRRTAPALVWLALLESGFGPGRTLDAGAARARLGELGSVLERVRVGQTRTLIGRALAEASGEGGPTADELASALDAARAFERGGTFATRRALAERALAWSGGLGSAWARLIARRAAPFGGQPSVLLAPAGPSLAGDPGLARRLEAGLVAERLARWTARPAEELAVGRLVLPLDELARCGLAPTDMVARPDDPRWRELVAGQVGFVRGHLARAWPAAQSAGPLAGRAVALWLDGIERCLARIEARGFDVVRAPVAGPRASLLGAFARRPPADLRGLG